MQRISVVMALLLPESTMESPNTNSAGGRVWFAAGAGASTAQQVRRISTAVAITIRRDRDTARVVAMPVLPLCLPEL